jgi:predicted transcriptional regulator
MMNKATTEDESSMALSKTTIAVPEDLLDAVDRVAAERGESRSRFINRVLREAVRARRDAAITARLDAFLSDDRFGEAQQKAAAALDELGADWSDERW